MSPADAAVGAAGNSLPTRVSPALPAGSPERFVQDFYDWYVLASSGRIAAVQFYAAPKMRAGLAPQLLAALQADAAAQAADTTGSVVGIDWDPFLASQDPCRRYDVTAPAERRSIGYVVHVHGVGICPPHDRPDVSVAVRRGDSSWTIVDVTDSSSHGTNSLLESLHALDDSRRHISRDTTATPRALTAQRDAGADGARRSIMMARPSSVE
jgi:hypothetical protein